MPLPPQTDSPLKCISIPGGGYVHAGADIYTALCEYPGEVNIKIIYAASAASVIAMAGHSMISPVGQMMIHNVYSSADGDYRALHRAGDRLDIACDALANAYMRKTGKTRDEIRAMMDAETWVDARRAVELGLVDEVMAATLSLPTCPDCCPKASCKRRLPCSAIRTPLLWRRPKPIMKILSKKELSNMMTKEQYNAQRTKLLNDMRAAIRRGRHRDFQPLPR